MIKPLKKKLVVVGNGMVGQRFCEQMVELDIDGEYEVIVFGDEPRPAYDRVRLTSYFEHYEADQLLIQSREWYDENGVELNVSSRITSLDREEKIIEVADGRRIPYDKLVLATGSTPFVPPVPGLDKKGVFVYRTIEDLEAITEYSKEVDSALVIGGGLLGLEAAKACQDLGLKVSVVEHSPRLLARQLDDKGSDLLIARLEGMGISVTTGAGITKVLGNGKIVGAELGDTSLDVGMIVVAAGIRPADKLGRDAELTIGDRGGIVVNGTMTTSDLDIYAIGECASFEGMCYGLVAPGFDMAEVLAKSLLGGDAEFKGADMSTKLKLMGVDVASVGNPFLEENVSIVEYADATKGIYKKLVLCEKGEIVHGAVLVGDVSDFGNLALCAKKGRPLPMAPGALLVGDVGSGGGQMALEDDDVLCSCKNVTCGSIKKAIHEDGARTVGALKSCTKAGTGCGGCTQMVANVLKAELEEMGEEVDTSLCEHFSYSRRELLDIVKVKKFKAFEEVLAAYGKGYGCEACKTTVASIVASLWNEPVLEQPQIQETNDKYLANIQRNGTYSVIPRSPGGELTPEQMIVMGEVALEYDLYTKLTGSQRVAMFGAHVQDLPAIWERLQSVGLESGHAYAKGLRMVKSCVGSTWCRFGVDASVDFAIELENRYKGMRSPHKLKAGVSGCTRECAEAMCKDFGLIATDNGWNLYVCGNGGTYPRHADLLASDIDRETATKYIDRFLMYYIRTADRLQRTAVWLGDLPGGIEKLRSVIVDDSLQICSELEADMQSLVDCQFDEWALACKDEKQRATFTHFANSDEKDEVQMIEVREQSKPALWEKDYVMVEVSENLVQDRNWVLVGTPGEVPANGGATFKVGRHQVAVFNFASTGEWYACQNLCPHKREMVLSRGLLGDMDGIPKVVCPMHKKAFSLEDGKGLSDEIYSIQTFPVKVEDGKLMIELPDESFLDKLHSCDPREVCNADVATSELTTV